MSVRIHLRNLSVNWGGHAATLIVMFFLSPYIVGKLDSVSYGIWSLLNVLTGYMGVFDLGVRSSVGRHVALYLGKDDEVGVDETIRAGFGFFSLSGIIILIIGILGGWFFPVVFRGISPENYYEIRLLLPFMVINVWLSAIAAIYSSVIVSYDRFDIAKSIDMVVLLVRTIGTIVALKMGFGLWGLALSLIIGNIVAVVGNRICAGNIHKKLRTFPFLYSYVRLKELFNYGIPAFISKAAFKIIGQSDLIIVGIFLSVAEVREYSVGAMLVYYSGAFISLIGGSFFPTIQRTVSGGTLGEVKYLFFRQLRITLCFGFLVYIGFVFYSKPFINLWMFQDGFDSSSVSVASKIMCLLSLAKIASLYSNPCVTVLSAMGYVAFTAKIFMIEAITNLFFSLLYVLIFKFGIVGVALGTLTARLIVSSFFIPPYLCRKLDINLYVFLKSFIMPSLISISLFSSACFLMLTFLAANTWPLFFLHIFFAALIWGGIVTFLLLPNDLRQQVKRTLKKRIKKLG